MRHSIRMGPPAAEFEEQSSEWQQQQESSPVREVQ